MRLGYTLGYWSSGPPEGAAAALAEAERLGFDTAWSAESYGSDAFTPLAWWGASTSRIRLGTAVAQMAGRTPAATAMAAMTLDHLTGGRFVLGLGASGPQVVEGWYGQPYTRPLARTREYIEIIRRILAREAPVEHDGEYYPLPYPGGTGLGKPLKPTVHPLRADLPIHLAAEGPKNVALAAEVADGWLSMLFSPKTDAFYREALAEGFARPGARRGPDDFEVSAIVPVVIDEDVERAADGVRPYLALYIGGMGAKGKNFHRDVIARMGYEAVCDRVQQLFLSGDKAGAVAAVPTELVEDLALVGPAAKVRDEVARWQETVLTSMSVSGDAAALREIAAAVGG